VAPVTALIGCDSEEPAAEQPTSPATTTAPPPGTERLSTQLKTADGRPVANATIDFSGGFATVTVETIEDGILRPGFHGLHIHSAGRCEASSVAPTGGPTGDFNSAGGHYQAPGHTGHPASGDLTSLQVRSDGGARLVTTTDSFTAADLLDGEKTALIIHQNPDNFGHIPQDRYRQTNGSPGPDQDTLATGDAGQRVACGVIDSVSATATTTTTTTTTTTPATVTETTVISPTTTVVPPPAPTTTTTETATITVPTITSPILTPPQVPEIPGPPPIPPVPGGG
jgi:Cu-Zn family superoxide dismutase